MASEGRAGPWGSQFLLLNLSEGSGLRIHEAKCRPASTAPFSPPLLSGGTGCVVDQPFWPETLSGRPQNPG